MADGGGDEDIVVDSGAMVTVLPREFASQYPILPSRASAASTYYTAAGGQRLYDEGCRVIGLDVGGEKGLVLRGRVAAVKRPLLAVRELTAAGHHLHFGDKEAHFESAGGAQRIPLSIGRGGAWVLKARVVAPAACSVRGCAAEGYA